MSDKETNRNRVRRILICPLQATGMRFHKRVSQDDTAQRLDNLCDALAFASDKTLDAVRSWAACHGEGSQRCFFPEQISFVTVAELYQPRRLEEVPAVASWFRSRAGVEAKHEKRLVAEFVFFECKKRPPMTDRERKAIIDRAVEWNSKLDRIVDRSQRNLAPVEEERAFLAFYHGIEARALVLVEQGEANRAADTVDAGAA